MEKHIEESMNKVKAIFDAVSDRIEKMEPGQKILGTAWAEELAAQFGDGWNGPSMYQVMRVVLVGYPGISMKRGRNGGITKL